MPKESRKRGHKHRGLKKVTPDAHKADDYIKKAEHNLIVMEYLMRGGFNDWAVQASFYAHYHCLLAVLQKHGYESRNQECTFAAIEYFIEKGMIALEKVDLYRVFNMDRHDQLSEVDIVDLRERFQYGTETQYEARKIEELLQQTLQFIERIKTILQT